MAVDQRQKFPVLSIWPIRKHSEETTPVRLQCTSLFKSPGPKIVTMVMAVAIEAEDLQLGDFMSRLFGKPTQKHPELGNNGSGSQGNQRH